MAFRFRVSRLREITPILENETEKTTEHEMQSAT